jgi:hypothetical protein
MVMRNAVLAAGLGMALMAGMAKAEGYKGYEMPPYAVEVAEGDFEVRAYGAHLVAEVQVKGSRDGAISAGFRVLAGYIFGGNDRGEKIAMTVPVAQSPVEGGVWTVRFMIPSGQSADTLPVPNDGSVRFVPVEPERQVALAFSGRGATRFWPKKPRHCRSGPKRAG